MWTVYKHTAPNGKVYIGITSQKVKNRWNNGNGYRSNKYFTRAIKKYGWENFNHEILFEGLTKKQAGEMEQHLIEKYDCIMPKGYNKSKGGEYGFSGVHHSVEARQKISEANKGTNSPWYGKHLSDETRRKISEVKKRAFLNNPDLRRKIGEANKGRPSARKDTHLSSETRQKISESKKGSHHSPETRQKISEAHKGAHLSDETRKKMSESMKGKNAKAVICVETGILYSSTTEAAKSIGVSTGVMSMAVRGIRKTSGGYHWKYAEMQ